MCLGIPSRVVRIDGQVAILDVMGTVREARLELMDGPVIVGDYVLSQLGFVTGVLSPEEAKETLALFEIVLADLDQADAAPARSA